MKLVEILARELKEWPDGYKYIAQDGCNLDCQVTAYKRKPSFAIKNKDEWGVKGSHDFEYYYPDIEVSDLASNYQTAIVTRADWEAERARITKPSSKPNKDGWIRHRGGKCPVDAGVLVDVRHRDGDIFYAESALEGFAETWIHSRSRADIMAYRTYKPAEQDIYADDKDESSEPVQVTYADGPLQWRDRITEIDRTVEALEEERVALVQRLEDEGFRLIERVVQPVEDMSDPANWRKGDLITFELDRKDSSFTTGKQYTLSRVDGHGSVHVDHDDEGDKNGWAAEYFKWHSRPSK